MSWLCNFFSSGLLPVNNTNIGELIPVSLTEETHSSEDSVSVPSFSEVNSLYRNMLLYNLSVIKNMSDDTNVFV
jgi:hypothetical protein